MGMFERLFGESDNAKADQPVSRGLREHHDPERFNPNQDILLQGGSPLHVALLPTDEAGVVRSNYGAQAAKENIEKAYAISPDAVKALAGSTPTEAAAVIREILRSSGTASADTAIN